MTVWIAFSPTARATQEGGITKGPSTWAVSLGRCVLGGCDQFCMAVLEIEHSEPFNFEAAAGSQGGGWKALGDAGRPEEDRIWKENIYDNVDSICIMTFSLNRYPEIHRSGQKVSKYLSFFFRLRLPSLPGRDFRSSFDRCLHWGGWKALPVCLQSHHQRQAGEWRTSSEETILCAYWNRAERNSETETQLHNSEIAASHPVFKLLTH